MLYLSCVTRKQSEYAIVKASSLWFLLCEANQYQTVLCNVMNKSSESLLM